MSVFYRKYQNRNPHSVSYGKWFARAVTLGKTINVDELAKHIGTFQMPAQASTLVINSGTVSSDDDGLDKD